MNQQLLTDRKLAKELGPPFTRSSIHRLRKRGLIPFLQFGYRTILYDKARVLEALGRCEVKPVTTATRVRAEVAKTLAQSERKRKASAKKAAVVA